MTESTQDHSPKKENLKQESTQVEPQARIAQQEDR